MKSILLTDDLEARDWLLRHLDCYVLRHCTESGEPPVDRLTAQVWPSPWKDRWILPSPVEERLSAPKALNECPLRTRVEEALPFLHQQLDQFRRCQNQGCPEPFFIAEHRNQKYCSTACSLPAKRKAKLAWWNKNRGGRANRISLGAKFANRKGDNSDGRRV